MPARDAVSPPFTPARRIAAPLFGIGVFACGINGCVGLAAIVILTLGTRFWAMAPAMMIASAVIVAFGMVFAPINLILLPLAYAGFRRSSRLRAALRACGLFGGLFIALVVIRHWPIPETPTAFVVLVMLATGIVNGWVSASLFLRLLR